MEEAASEPLRILREEVEEVAVEVVGAEEEAEEAEQPPGRVTPSRWSLRNKDIFIIFILNIIIIIFNFIILTRVNGDSDNIVINIILIISVIILLTRVDNDDDNYSEMLINIVASSSSSSYS